MGDASLFGSLSLRSWLGKLRLPIPVRLGLVAFGDGGRSFQDATVAAGSGPNSGAVRTTVPELSPTSVQRPAATGIHAPGEQLAQ